MKLIVSSESKIIAGSIIAFLILFQLIMIKTFLLFDKTSKNLVNFMILFYMNEDPCIVCHQILILFLKGTLPNLFYQLLFNMGITSTKSIDNWNQM
jgi:hypothetical protein